MLDIDCWIVYMVLIKGLYKLVMNVRHNLLEFCKRIELAKLHFKQRKFVGCMPVGTFVYGVCYAKACISCYFLIIPRANRIVGIVAQGYSIRIYTPEQEMHQWNLGIHGVFSSTFGIPILGLMPSPQKTVLCPGCAVAASGIYAVVGVDGGVRI